MNEDQIQMNAINRMNSIYHPKDFVSPNFWSRASESSIIPKILNDCIIVYV